MFLSLCFSTTLYGQSITLEVIRNESLPGRLPSVIMQSNNTLLPSSFTRAALIPGGVLFGVDESGQTIRFDLITGNSAYLSISKEGFIQAAPILISGRSVHHAIAVIPKLFLSTSDAPVGLVRKINFDGIVQDVYQTKNGWIRSAGMSHDGRLIGIAVAESAVGEEDNVMVLDVYGNVLGEYTLEQDIQGIEFTADMSHVILYSSNRVGVFDLITGERKGGASIRTGILTASYVPEDDVIIAVGEIRVTIVNLQKRSISNGEFPTNQRFSTDESSTLRNRSRYETDLNVYPSDAFIPLYEPFGIKRFLPGDYELNGFYGQNLKVSS